MQAKFKKNSRPALTEVTITPAPGMILIRKIEDGIAQKSGIVVPHAERTDNYLAEVLAVSPLDRVENGVVIPKFVSAGAIVILKTYASGQILSKEDGESQHLVDESHVCGVIERVDYDRALANLKAAQEAALA